MPDSSIKDNNCDFVFFASLFVEDDDDDVEDEVVVCFRLLLVAAFVDVDAMSTMSDFNDDDADVVPSSPSVFSFGLRNNNRPVESTHFRSSSTRNNRKRSIINTTDNELFITLQNLSLNQSPE